MWIFLIGACLFFGAYLLSAVAMQYISNKDTEAEEYSFGSDSFWPLWSMMSCFLIALYAFMPQMYDSLVPPKISYLLVPIVFSALIYLAYLLETERLFYSVILLSSCAAVWVYPFDRFLLGSFLPFLWLDRILAVLIIFSMCAAVPFLNGLRGHFSIFTAGVLLGVFVFSLCGGVPLFLGLIGIFWAGLSVAFCQFNIFSYKIELNNGAASAMMFSVAWLLLYTGAEYASSSTLVLLMYYVAEIVWSTIHYFMKKAGSTELSENSAYYRAFESYDYNLFGAAVSILKINLINIVIASFQLFATNSVVLPVLTFMINIWMFGKIGNSAESALTFKETNAAFVQELKNNVNEIKEILHGKTNLTDNQKKAVKSDKKKPSKRNTDHKNIRRRKKADVS